MVPHAFRFAVEENKGIAIGPPAGTQRQHLSINFATVHGSQIDERSSCYDDWGEKVGEIL